MKWRIKPRRNICHDQLANATRKAQGKLHRGFATHRMAEHVRPLQSLRAKKFVEIFGHERVTHFGSVPGVAMITLLERENMEELSELITHSVPIVRVTE